jgi:beta-galactosidase
VQNGINRQGKNIHYYFNYSGKEVTIPYSYASGVNLLDGKRITHHSQLTLVPWDVAIIEE